MNKRLVTALTIETAYVCGIYLVGGFDSEKKHRPALDIFRPGLKESLYDLCLNAESGCNRSREQIENLIMRELALAEHMHFDYIDYHFNITEFECKHAMKKVVSDVLAQVNEQ